jgi:hypothetical protein
MREPGEEIRRTRPGIARGLPAVLAALPGDPLRELDTESGDPLGYTSPS